MSAPTHSLVSGDERRKNQKPKRRSKKTLQTKKLQRGPAGPLLDGVPLQQLAPQAG